MRLDPPSGAPQPGASELRARETGPMAGAAAYRRAAAEQELDALFLEEVAIMLLRLDAQRTVASGDAAA